MTAKNKFKSPAFEAIHSAASGLFSVDAIPQETMRNFDKACLSSVEDLQPLEIKALREKLNGQPARFRALSEYQRFYSAKMGERRKAPRRYSIEASYHCAKARTKSAGLMSLADKQLTPFVICKMAHTVLNATSARHLQVEKGRCSVSGRS